MTSLLLKQLIFEIIKDIDDSEKVIIKNEKLNKKNLFIRFGKFSNSPSQIGLDSEFRQDVLGGKTHEDGLSVFFIKEVGKSGEYVIEQPDKNHARYHAASTSSYFTNMIEIFYNSIENEEVYIVEGNLIETVEEHYDEARHETIEYHDYSHGSDGEPLLETSSISIVKELTIKEILNNVYYGKSFTSIGDMKIHGKTLNSIFSNLNSLIESIIAQEILPLTESKQALINLGYPSVVASLISAKFKKHDFTVAKWFKENSSYAKEPNWFQMQFSDFSRHGPSLGDLINIYEAAQASEEKYRAVMNRLEYKNVDEEDFDQVAILNLTKRKIEYKLFGDNIFFTYYVLIKDIMSGKLTDLKPYQNLSFEEAKDKYDQKHIFGDVTPLKVYPDGYKWINVGDKCQLVGKQMKNCGSSGVMSMDPDRTILTLFDANNKPHVMVTYSPGDKRLSGDEGVGSSAVKDVYHDYILDLANLLGVNLDYGSTKSYSLKLKSALNGQLKSIENIESNSIYDHFYKISLLDNSVYYTDTYGFIPVKDVVAVAGKNGDVLDALKKMFNHQTSSQDFEKINFYNFINGQR